MMVGNLWWHMLASPTTKHRPIIGSYEGECLLVVWAISSFRCYLYGSPFTLVIDHQPLKFLMESNQLIGKLAKWAFIFREYDFDIVSRAGKVNRDVSQ
jgi:hypothetical protein